MLLPDVAERRWARFRIVRSLSAGSSTAERPMSALEYASSPLRPPSAVDRPFGRGVVTIGTRPFFNCAVDAAGRQVAKHEVAVVAVGGGPIAGSMLLTR